MCDTESIGGVEQYGCTVTYVGLLLKEASAAASALGDNDSIPCPFVRALIGPKKLQVHTGLKAATTVKRQVL